MKKAFIISTLIFVSTAIHAQSNYTIESTFQPLSYEAMVMGARAKASRFERYRDKAYECSNNKDYSGFLYYSSMALKSGYYSAKLYNDRGIAYEIMGNYSKALKEYKRALRKGYYEAEASIKRVKAKKKEKNKR